MEKLAKSLRRNRELFVLFLFRTGFSKVNNLASFWFMIRVGSMSSEYPCRSIIAAQLVQEQ
jgi:hypothetical protein